MPLFLLLYSLLIGQGRAVRTVENGGVTVTQKTLGQCTALAPADWQMVGTSPQADAVDLSSGDQRSYAGWGVRGVNRQMQPYYGDAYGDPVTSSRFLVNMIGQKTFGDTGPFNYTSQQLQLGGGFIAAELQSTAHINCTTMFRAPPAGDTQLPRPGDAFDRRRRGNETNDLEDYNAQLGTQYVHSPSTGQNYLVDRTAAWNDTGPDGPGFYRKVGNSYEKLEAGMR